MVHQIYFFCKSVKKDLTRGILGYIITLVHKAPSKYADMAESADALDSGSSRGNSVEVQVLLSAPKHSNPNLLPIGETFGFVVYLDSLK